MSNNLNKKTLLQLRNSVCFIIQIIIYGGSYMSKLHKLDYESPIGVIEIIGTDEAISSIMFAEGDSITNRMQVETPEFLSGLL